MGTFEGVGVRTAELLTFLLVLAGFVDVEAGIAVFAVGEVGTLTKFNGAIEGHLASSLFV